ncbi:MAG: hypothetical protein H6633_25695 [Anaerolineales bacterium]|nr:hypothetical protein [Anaerolineales bacterium]
MGRKKRSKPTIITQDQYDGPNGTIKTGDKVRLVRRTGIAKVIYRAYDAETGEQLNQGRICIDALITDTDPAHWYAHFAELFEPI